LKPVLIDTKPVPEPIQGSGIETNIDGKVGNFIAPLILWLLETDRSRCVCEDVYFVWSSLNSSRYWSAGLKECRSSGPSFLINNLVHCVHDSYVILELQQAESFNGQYTMIPVCDATALGTLRTRLETRTKESNMCASHWDREA
ncbi:hypothetical protein M0802_014838, partial [Mischocyttarus mexicanus]